MKHTKTFENFINESESDFNDKLNENKYSDRHNTLYWKENRLYYQIPYILSGEREKVNVDYGDKRISDATEKEMLDIVKKANDEMNKLISSFEESIKKTGEAAAAKLNNIVKSEIK